jgi:hypothetical protein
MQTWDVLQRSRPYTEMRQGGGRAMPENGETLEERAKTALRNYNQKAENLRVIEVMSNFMGQTLVLIEFDQNGKAEEWGVLVDGGNTRVYYDRSELLRRAADYKPNWLQQISSSQFILFLLTVTILAASVVSIFVFPNLNQSLSAALSSVLGFWLGRAARA